MEYLDERKEQLRTKTVHSARPYILDQGYFHDGFVLPGRSMPGDFNIDLRRADWTQRFPVSRTNSLDIVVDKSNHGIRRYSLIHPYIYWHLAIEFLDDFDRIKGLLLEETGVDVYSIPNFEDNDISEGWQHFKRIDLAQSLWGDFEYVATCDIYNFYESIYTHSIAWAIETKDVAKASRGTELIGNRIDKLFQNAHDGQTNGIPTGNVLSDLAAELILKDVDRLLANFIRAEGIKALRFRDDYRFVCKSKDQALKIIDELAYQLNKEYGLTLNKSKTGIQTVASYIQSFALDYKLPGLIQTTPMSDVFTWSSFYGFLVDSRNADKKRRGLFDAHVESFVNKLRSEGPPSNEDDDLVNWIDTIYVLLIDTIESGISTSPHLYIVLDFLLSELGDSAKRTAILDNLAGKVENTNNQVRIVWTYALLAHFDEERAGALIQVVDSDLLRFIVESGTADIDKFSSRDPIPEEDMEILRRIQIFDFNFVNDAHSIGEDELLLGALDEMLYNSLSLSHYMNR